MASEETGGDSTTGEPAGAKHSVSEPAAGGGGGGDSYEVIGGLTEMSYNTFPDDAPFTGVMREAELALDNGLKPHLSRKGTSGCYFIPDRERVGMLLKF